MCFQYENIIILTRGERNTTGQQTDCCLKNQNLTKHGVEKGAARATSDTLDAKFFANPVLQ